MQQNDKNENIYLTNPVWRGKRKAMEDEVMNITSADTQVSGFDFIPDMAQNILDLEIMLFVIFSPSRLFGPHLNLQFCVGGMLGWEQTNEIDLTFVNKRVNGTKPLHRRLFVYNYKADIGFISLWPDRHVFYLLSKS